MTRAFVAGAVVFGLGVFMGAVISTPTNKTAK